MIHYILIFSLCFGHQSFANNGNALSEESERARAAQAILEKSAGAVHTLPGGDFPVHRTVIQGPNNPEGRIELLITDHPDLELLVSAQKEAAEKLGFSQEEIETVIKTMPDGEIITATQVDYEKYPEFNELTKKILEEKRQERLEREAAEQRSIAASESMKKEKSETRATFMIRWFSSVFFFTTILTPSTFELVMISMVSWVNTFVLNNKMLQVEGFTKTLGYAARYAPMLPLQAGEVVAKQFFNPKAVEIMQWSQTVYKDKVLNNHFVTQASHLGAIFVLQMGFVAAYTVAMNLSVLGFDTSVLESGRILEYGDVIYDAGIFKIRSFEFFPDSFNLASFKAALLSDFNQFQFSKIWDLWTAAETKLVATTAIFTYFSKSWDTYRIRYRDMLSSGNQTKANHFGRMMGVFFALMTPVIYQGTPLIHDVLSADFYLNGFQLSQSTGPLSYLGAISIGVVGALGMLFTFGDAPKYIQAMENTKDRAVNAVRTAKNKTVQGAKNVVGKTKTAFSNFTENSLKLARAGLLGSYMGMIDLVHLGNDLYNRTPTRNWKEVPTLALSKVSSVDVPVSCKMSSL